MKAPVLKRMLQIQTQKNLRTLELSNEPHIRKSSAIRSIEKSLQILTFPQQINLIAKNVFQNFLRPWSLP